MWFLTKVLLAGLIIAFASWLAGRKPVLAGFIVALPLISMLAIIFSYVEFKDMNKINQFTSSIFVAIPLSLTFFIPFRLNKWLKMNFTITYGLAIICLILAYFVHHMIFRSGFLR